MEQPHQDPRLLHAPTIKTACKASLAVHSRGGGGRLKARLVPSWSTWCSINQVHQSLQLQMSHILCCAYCLHGLELLCQISIHGLCMQHRFRYLSSCSDVHFPTAGLRCYQLRKQEGLNEMHRLSSGLQRSLIDCLVAQPEKNPVFIEVWQNLSKCRFYANCYLSELLAMEAQESGMNVRSWTASHTRSISATIWHCNLMFSMKAVMYIRCLCELEPFRCPELNLYNFVFRDCKLAALFEEVFAAHLDRLQMGCMEIG